jgi:hypothetical protein
MLRALSDGTSALTDLRVAVRMDDRAQVRKALAEVGKSPKTFNDLQPGAAVKPVLSMMLGVMTAIGSFVDIGNLVTSGIAGARFGMTR